ncbi:uncharacterized protein SCHCODRAFT_02691957 [Schizophyllum commune H4-8]|nr:uncharacterized protein SCHCODRAFT_02691957 [Schizophyllum commune H4-8]KAI5888647.1 hypothetical protein SCHCODRAFT_02691957 [Schizophyllum commune H4-8]
MFPAELYEAFIDQLDGEKHALAMCALTHRSLLDVSQQRLFADIRLNFDSHATETGSRITQLLAALDTSPRLGSYVRRFTISCEADGEAHLHCASLLPPLLDHLSALRCYSSRRVFNSAGDPVERAVERVLQLPTLEEVCLRLTFDFPFHLIRSPSVRHLALTDAGETGITALRETEQPPLKLLTLKLCASTEIAQARAAEWLNSAQVDLSDLRAFMLDPGWLSPSSARRFLSTFAGTLQLLALIPHNTNSEVTHDFLRIMAQPSLCWPSLRTLVLYATKGSDFGLRIHPLDKELMRSLDAALAERKDMYPALQDVIIRSHADLVETPLYTLKSKTTDGEEWWRLRDPVNLWMAHSVVERILNAHREFVACFPKCAEAGLLRDTPSTNVVA